MWLYNKKEVSEIPENAFGFIYLLTFTDKKSKKKYYYIGKKNFFCKRTKKLGVKALAARIDKRSSKVVKTVCESDWKNYYSSNVQLKEQAKVDKSCMKREILQVAYSNKELSYLETKYLFVNEVLEKEEYLNGNILGRYFKLK